MINKTKRVVGGGLSVIIRVPVVVVWVAAVVLPKVVSAPVAVWLAAAGC